MKGAKGPDAEEIPRTRVLWWAGWFVALRRGGAEERYRDSEKTVRAVFCVFTVRFFALFCRNVREPTGPPKNPCARVSN